MRSKLHHNAIFTSYYNSFCLVCECYLDSDDLALRHIDLYEHEQNLLSFPYLEKYERDNIRVVKYGYFCEYCNKLMPTSSKIDFHIDKTDHYDNKRSNLFQRVNGAVVAYNQLVIDERSWHSITDGACAICNEVIEDEANHIDDPLHLIQLVQSKVEIKDNGLYRMTKDASFQCLTCNVILANIKIDEHFNDSEHQKLLASCEEALNEVYSNNKGAIPKNDTSKSTDILIKKFEDNIKKHSKKSSANHGCYICAADDISDYNVSASNSTVVEIDSYNNEMIDNLSSIHFENEITKQRGLRNDKNTDAFKALKLGDTDASDFKQFHNDIDNASNAVQFVNDESLDKDKAQNTNNAQNDGSTQDEVNARASNTGISQYEDAESNAIIFKNEFDSTFALKLNKDNAQIYSKPQKKNTSKALTPERDTSVQTNVANKDKIYPLDITTEVKGDVKSIINNNNETDNHNFLTKPKLEIQQLKQDVIDSKDIVFSDTPSTIASVEEAYSLPFPNDPFQRSENTVERLALENNMILAKQGTAYCKLCLIKVKLEMKDMWSHLLTRKHMTIDAQTKHNTVGAYITRFTPERAIIPFKMPMIDFVWHTQLYERYCDIVLNKTFCLTRWSCLFLYKISERYMMCHLCNIKKPIRNPELHITNSYIHESRMNLSLVLTELKEEFVREISPTKYHCGFCNILLPTFIDLMDHLRGTYHRDRKINAYNSLYEYAQFDSQLNAIANIAQGLPFVPNWTGRNPPGVY